MDVLTEQYCGLIRLPVFRPVFFAHFVSHMMDCNKFEKDPVMKFLAWNGS